MAQQFKLRMPEKLREALEEARRQTGISLNSEIVQRLDRSVHAERVLGSREMTRLNFAMTAAFAASTEAKDWSNDPVAYANGAAAVLAALIRGMPEGPDKATAMQGLVSRAMALALQERPAQAQEHAA
jgi:hypothetical protein